MTPARCESSGGSGVRKTQVVLGESRSVNAASIQEIKQK